MIRTIHRSVVSALLIAEFLLSGVGFCGHTHTHAHPGAGCGIGFTQTEDDGCNLPHSHGHDADTRHGDGEGRNSHRTHCFCLGHVDAETACTVRPVFFSVTIMQFPPSSRYDFLFTPVIFHPPISA